MLLNRVKVKKSYAKHRHDSDVKHFVVQCRSVWCYGKPVIGLRSFLVFFAVILGQINSVSCVSLESTENYISCDAVHRVW